MDNQDNVNCPMNPIPNSGLFSPIKESPHKMPQPGRDNRFLYQISPYPSNLGINSTPSKQLNFGNGLCHSLGETPLGVKMNIQLSPFENNGIEVSNQKTQGQQRGQGFSGYSPYNQHFLSNSNQRIMEYNNYYGGFKGVNLASRFDEIEKTKPIQNNTKNSYSEQKNKEENIDNNNNINNNNEGTGNNPIYTEKPINVQKYKKFLFEQNDENSSSLQDNSNESINNGNINKKNENNKINISIESSSLLSDLKNIYGNNLVKNEFIFNSLNSSVLSNISFPKIDNNNRNLIQNQNIIINKKSLKNNEYAISNINSTTNISSSEKPASKCTCKNTNCLKFYCECFANGRFCDNCVCENCKNTQEFKELRFEKYNLIISRNPKAIQKINSTKRSWTCKCKNSNCSKKYCDCYQNGRFCTSKCRCVNCYNKNNGKTNIHEKKIKRIRGVKKEKMNLLINRKNKKRKIIKNDENENKNKKGEDIINEIENENEKKLKDPLFNFYTPKKQRNNFDKNNFIYYQNESTTAALTGKKDRRKKLFDYKDKKIKDVYTKLTMDSA